jgi:hypothetical protein
MTIFERLEQWKERGVLSAEQHTLLAGLSRGEPFSVFLELNILLYAGILAFVGGLGWTVSTWSRELGDVVIVAVLTGLLAASLWYCFKRGAAWSAGEVASPSLVFDYVLYLGCLVWSVELGYIEYRLHVLGGQWDWYLLATAGLFFFLAYRFDNRFVLSLALSSLAGWFGLTISRWPSNQDAEYRAYAILYSLVVGGMGSVLKWRDVKAHFFGTHLNIAANVFFWAVLSGVFQREGYGLWLLALVVGCGAAFAWGLKRREFAFVAYAAVYGYVGISSILIRDLNDAGLIFFYFFMTGIGMLGGLIMVARRFGREA